MLSTRCDDTRFDYAARIPRAANAGWRGAALALAIASALGACGKARDTSGERGHADTRATAAIVVADTGTVAYDAGSAELPRIRFGDGQLSLNDRCIVRQVKLNLRLPPIYVNGRPIGFC